MPHISNSNKTANNIEPEALERIKQAINSIAHGTITLVVQDNRLLQIELHEKIKIPLVKETKSGMESQNAVCNKLPELIAGLQYGQVVMIIQNHMIVRLERTEKIRVGDLQGVYGDGI